MQLFDPATALSPRGSGADEGAIIRMSQKTRELRAKGHDVVSLTLGEPDFDTPKHIRDAAKSALDNGMTHYAPVAGIPELREAIALKLQTENGLNYSAANLVLANGAKQAIANAVLSVVGPGDEVIILAPYWVSYEATVKFTHGTPVVLESTVAENYKVPAERIAAAVTDKTKLLILNSPCNPTGAVWTQAELEDIAAVVRANPRMMVLADEIYEYILFDGAMVSFGSLPGMIERTITLNGFSKGFAMTGWRLGYAAAAEPIAKAMARMQRSYRLVRMHLCNRLPLQRFVVQGMRLFTCARLIGGGAILYSPDCAPSMASRWPIYRVHSTRFQMCPRFLAARPTTMLFRRQMNCATICWRDTALPLFRDQPLADRIRSACRLRPVKASWRRHYNGLRQVSTR
jgi:aspartate/methionine/tyrosine aminotransferase